MNAFRQGLDGADSFEKRSLSSVHSHLSLHTLQLRTAAMLAAEQKSALSSGYDTALSSLTENFSSQRV